VFINNAYNYDFSQVELLYKLYDKFKNKKCTIISIGSVSGDGDRNRLFPYAIHKSALEKASTQLSLLNTECKICLIKPGRINTDMTKNREEYYRMSPSEIMDVIEFILSRPEKLIIKSITIDVHNSNMVI
jgi:NADP-dependent 3-hydroxy acid dehydrogenase YdfG